LRFLRRISQIEEELARLADGLAPLNDSPLGKLKTMVDEAAAQGKDLVRDMIGRLKRDIMVAQIVWPRSGRLIETTSKRQQTSRAIPIRHPFLDRSLDLIGAQILAGRSIQQRRQFLV
jgi:hypothetical protein